MDPCHLKQFKYNQNLLKTIGHATSNLFLWTFKSSLILLVYGHFPNFIHSTLAPVNVLISNHQLSKFGEKIGKTKLNGSAVLLRTFNMPMCFINVLEGNMVNKMSKTFYSRTWHDNSMLRMCITWETLTYREQLKTKISKPIVCRPNSACCLFLYCLGAINDLYIYIYILYS